MQRCGSRRIKGLEGRVQNRQLRLRLQKLPLDEPAICKWSISAILGRQNPVSIEYVYRQDENHHRWGENDNVQALRGNIRPRRRQQRTPMRRPKRLGAKHVRVLRRRRGQHSRSRVPGRIRCYRFGVFRIRRRTSPAVHARACSTRSHRAAGADILSCYNGDSGTQHDSRIGIYRPSREGGGRGSMRNCCRMTC